MKRLLSIFCMALCMHSIGAPPAELVKSSQKTSGERQLVKALATIVNREGNKKITFRRIEQLSAEWPWV